jgi:hypothetical protein
LVSRVFKKNIPAKKFTNITSKIRIGKSIDIICCELTIVRITINTMIIVEMEKIIKVDLDFMKDFE